MRTNEIKIKGKISIIPNGTEVLDFRHPLTKHIVDEIQSWLGIKVVPNERVAQVWVTNVDDITTSDWACYGVFSDPDKNPMRAFPRYVPTKHLKCFKEGDTMLFWKGRYGVEIELAVEQLTTKYSDAGNFEECFAKGCKR